MAAARDAHAAELLNGAEPARSVRGSASLRPTAARLRLRRAAPWGVRSSRAPLGAMRKDYKLS